MIDAAETHLNFESALDSTQKFIFLVGYH